MVIKRLSLKDTSVAEGCVVDDHLFADPGDHVVDHVLVVGSDALWFKSVSFSTTIDKWMRGETIP
jgi:hypothetical protein